MATLDWDSARNEVHLAASEAKLIPLRQKPSETDGATLAAPLTALTPLPAFDTSSVDGYAVRGPGPWRLTGRILAGQTASEIETGCAIEVATGAMVPRGLDAIVRLEDATVTGDKVTGTPRDKPEWRRVGEESELDEELLPAGTPVTPAVIGMAATAGYDTIEVRPKPRAAVLVFGDELASEGKPGNGRVRDALGPMMPNLLRRAGAAPVPGFCPRGPIEDNLDSHIAVLRAALDDADIVCTTGGTMHGPVDHLHPALTALGAKYVVNTVAVRPGFPMLVASLPGQRFVAGLPGNPQSAVVALASLVVPLIAGLSGRVLPPLPRVQLAADIPGRGPDTHLALVRQDATGLAHPLPHTGSSMLRGLASAVGFAVVEPGESGKAGQSVRLLPLPGGAG
ncbi:molybdopterin molybdotransferase MoeA [Stackebrandtia nassauensis]|uniref:Molybdopterin molybdenumtransferase n=1 Tax=Stackebrandtia nassauensis (strain DSM 44728 / CIP 108903 / NRRL B-16338 / NBRC 102104 / LLR-40K-21) TaxID=446470 RepID=D3Q466_STANL|nr:molybdopterin molybdotransferase MoeA [Stackebrandtia nassauensis]ADD45951.1 MoeA domain protein domain I and II [Stackebrandtia nassauensis DSM 44728]